MSDNRQKPIVVGLVEDDQLLANSLKILLSGEKGILVMGIFPSAEECIAFFSTPKNTLPDILVIDLALPGMSGCELIGKAAVQFPKADIMVLTNYADRENVFKALKAGASGYLLKDASPREIVEALYCLSNGGAPMTPKIARMVIKNFQDVNNTACDPALTPREKELLSGISHGESYKELARRFKVSTNTIHFHIKRIYVKLQAHGRKEALARARREGLL